MITQYYSMLLRNDDPVPEIGSPVFDDEHETLIGFINDVQSTYMDIVLIEPEDLDFEPYRVLEMSQTWDDMLINMIERTTPIIKDYWIKLLSDQHLFKRTIH